MGIDAGVKERLTMARVTPSLTAADAIVVVAMEISAVAERAIERQTDRQMQ